jgi:hypothetical protein
MFLETEACRAVAALTLLGASHLAWPHLAFPNRDVLGWIEWITIAPWGLSIKTRLDTGANTASLHPLGIERFTRDGGAWVRIRLALDGAIGEHGKIVDQTIKIARLLGRDVLIKRRGSGYEQRAQCG